MLLPSSFKNKQYKQLVWVSQSRSYFATELLLTGDLLVSVQSTKNKRFRAALTGGRFSKLIAIEVQLSCRGNKKREITILKVNGRNANSSNDTLVI